MKNTIIRCKSEEEYRAVLKKLEDKGCMWSSGHKPTEITKYYRDGYNLLLVSDDRIATSSSDSVLFDKNNYKNYEYIAADDFIGNKPIVIYRVGRTVVAIDQNTEETGVAKCHPSDDFDFTIGAKLAFERLLSCKNPVDEKQTAETENHKATKFKVGDIVRVKSSLIVGNEYGELTFFHGMAHNKKLIVDKVIKSNKYRCSDGFIYSEEMLESSSGFEVGDVVTVNLNAVVGEKYDGLTLFKDMASFGRPLEIKKIEKIMDGVYYYSCTNGYSYSEPMLKPFDDEITIGCEIEVIDGGKSYTTYDMWVDENVSNSKNKVRYDYGVSAEVGFLGTVIAIAPHMTDKTKNLVYFVHRDKCYLINADGVKKYDEQDG